MDGTSGPTREEAMRIMAAEFDRRADRIVELEQQIEHLKAGRRPVFWNPEGDDGHVFSSEVHYSMVGGGDHAGPAAVDWVGPAGPVDVTAFVAALNLAVAHGWTVEPPHA